MSQLDLFEDGAEVFGFWLDGDDEDFDPNKGWAIIGRHDLPRKKSGLFEPMTLLLYRTSFDAGASGRRGDLLVFFEAIGGSRVSDSGPAIWQANKFKALYWCEIKRPMFEEYLLSVSGHRWPSTEISRLPGLAWDLAKDIKKSVSFDDEMTKSQKSERLKCVEDAKRKLRASVVSAHKGKWVKPTWPAPPKPKKYQPSPIINIFHPVFGARVTVFREWMRLCFKWGTGEGKELVRMLGEVGLFDIAATADQYLKEAAMRGWIVPVGRSPSIEQQFFGVGGMAWDAVERNGPPYGQLYSFKPIRENEDLLKFLEGDKKEAA